MTDWPIYQGTKQLKATPMNKRDYCTYRGWTVPADEDPEEKGYIVEYQDGGKANVEGHEGYVSWTPADVFEKTYKPCGTFAERLKIEHDELNERYFKLSAFLATPEFEALDAADQALLRAQATVMLGYSDTLAARLHRVEVQPA